MCRECGVPLLVSKMYKWEDNGAIIQTGKQPIRMSFFDFDRIDGIFNGLSEMIGIPLEHITTECASRNARQYVDNIVPSPLRKTLRRIGFKQVVAYLCNLGKAYGYGTIRMLEMQRGKGGDYRLRFLVNNPHSLAIICGNILGAVESIEGRDAYSEYRQTDEDEYEVVIRLGSHRVELQGRFEERRYVYRPGRIEYDRCPACHIPLDMAAYRWDVETGIISHPVSKERIAFFTPWGLDAMLNELEVELQEAIPDMVVETQRLYARDRLQHITGWNEIETLFHGLAVRGLGSVSSLELDEDHLEMSVENSCMEPMLAGTAQGLYELASGRDSSTCRWNVTPDDVLTVEILRPQ
ncbi:MAG: hypothetical protein C4536_07230 [Actinobacteria bacterium]|jgi:hypothetical protein|nr:MAG: hypothetical protein C4536_07230 [Actinomycetota bacterium]